MNKRRLLKLAEFLETKEFPKGKFDLSTWMSGLGHVKNSGACEFSTRVAAEKRLAKDPTLEHEPAFEGDDSDDVRPIHCRTAGCALGWATTIPSFRRAGLKLHCPLHNATDSFAQATPRYGMWYGYDAAAVFFGIDAFTTETLFNPTFYSERQRRSPKAVAKRIRTLVEKGKVHAS